MHCVWLRRRLPSARRDSALAVTRILSSSFHPDAQTHVDAFADYVDAGFDIVHVSNVGPHDDGFFELYKNEVLPELKSKHTKEATK